MTEPLAVIQQRLREAARPNHGDMWTGVRWIALPFVCSCGVRIEKPAEFTPPHYAHEKRDRPVSR